MTTVYSYYENSLEPYSYGKMLSMTNPDGSWEKYFYGNNTLVSQVLRSWKDITLATATPTNCRATVYEYTFRNLGPAAWATAGVQEAATQRFLSVSYELIEGKMVRYTEYDAKRWNYINNTTAATPILAPNGQRLVTETRAELNLSVTSSTPSSSILTAITTTTSYAPSATAPFTGRIYSIEYPDGRSDTYDYEKGDWTPNANPLLGVFTYSFGNRA